MQATAPLPPRGQGQAPDYRPRPRRFRRQRLLIIGCGDIGRRVGTRLKDRWQVIGLARSDDTREAIRQAGLVAQPAPVFGPQADRARTRLHHLAAWATHILHSAPPPASSSGNGNGNGNDDPLTRHWLLRLRAARPRLAGTQPRRLVYLSTTGIYGNRHGEWVSETDAPRPQTGRAARRVAAERLLRQANRQAPDRLSTLVLRVPGIYGDDRLPVDRLRQLIPALLPEDDVITNHIHADDLARIAATALLRGPRQRTINAIDDSQLWLGDYLDLVADHLQLPRPPRFSRAELAQRLSPVRMSFMSESRRIRNQRLKRELRVRLRYPTVQDFLAGHVPSPMGS